MDIKSYLGKMVEIKIYRTRYKINPRIHKGKLVEVTLANICLLKKNRYVWVPRPRSLNGDTILEA